MTSQLVTIGLPFAHTPREYLEMAVRSVFAQTVDNWELLLLADGSHPELEECISQIDDSRVRLLADPVNRGLAARLNEVARMAAGDVVFRMDADDLMHPRRLERTLEEMRRHDVELVGGRAYAIDSGTQIMGLFREGGIPADRAGFLKSNAFTHPTVAASREWFLANPYDEELKRSEDKDLWLRSSAHTKSAKLDEVLLFYRLADLTAAKQARDARYDRRLLRRHGPELVGGAGTTSRLATSYAKQAVFAGLTRLGGQSVILRRKVASLESTSMAEAGAELRIARSAAVPGWRD
jgi:glycosyltransferase involved in cell wall biosynthesis